MLYVQANAAFSCALLSKSIVHARKILKISDYKQEQMHLKGSTSEYLLNHKNNLDVRPLLCYHLIINITKLSNSFRSAQYLGKEELFSPQGDYIYNHTTVREEVREEEREQTRTVKSAHIRSIFSGFLGPPFLFNLTINLSLKNKQY